MKIEDLTGLSKPLQKLIEVVFQGIGALSKPYLIKKTADAKAYEIKVIAEAIKEHQTDLKRIGFDDEKLSLTSLDESTIQHEPTLEERTQRRTEFKEQKKQKNIENITQKAAEHLENEKQVSDEPVDEDWTTRFFNYAEDISNEELQDLWARVLAGEVKQPRSYSLRTLELLRNLSKKEAETFMKFAKLAVQATHSSFILNFKSEKLLEEKYDLTFSDRLLMEELGLMTANDLQFKINETKDQKAQLAFVIGNICVIHEKLENKPMQNIQVLAFTKIGQELLELVSSTPEMDYIQLLATKIDRQNGSVKYAMILEQLPDGQIKHIGLQDVPLTDKEKDAEEKRKESEKNK
ncbi:MAG: DUF2806 domain-containing protein [Cyclobacteriaceae bacterium]